MHHSKVNEKLGPRLGPYAQCNPDLATGVYNCSHWFGSKGCWYNSAALYFPQACAHTALPSEDLPFTRPLLQILYLDPGRFPVVPPIMSQRSGTRLHKR